MSTKVDYELVPQPSASAVFDFLGDWFLFWGSPKESITKNQTEPAIPPRRQGTKSSGQVRIKSAIEAGGACLGNGGFSLHSQDLTGVVACYHMLQLWVKGS